MRKLLPALLLALPTLAFPACEGMAAPPPGWPLAWQQVAFLAILIGYLILGIMYMIGTGFNMPRLVASTKRDIMYLMFIAILAGSIVVLDDIMNNTFVPAFGTHSLLNITDPTRNEVTFCGSLPSTSGTWSNLQRHTVDYAVCLREKNTDYFKALMEINFITGFVSSINLVIYPLDIIGIGFSPGSALRPIIDTMGYGLYMLAITIAQLKVQEVVLCFSRYYMFSMVLPFGIALSAFSITRSAGGALISLAIGFYIVLPVCYLVSEEIVQDYCASHGQCDFGALDMFSAFLGNARDVTEQMFQNGGQNAEQLATILSLDGPFGPLVYIVAIASTLLPLCSLIVTLTFIKSFSTIFGGEVDFSAMIKLL